MIAQEPPETDVAPGGFSSTGVLKTLAIAGPTMIAGAALIAGPAAALLVIGEGVLAVLVVMVLTALVTIRVTEVVPLLGLK